MLRHYGCHLSQAVKDRQYLTAKARIDDKAKAVGFVVDRTVTPAAYLVATRRCKSYRCQCHLQYRAARKHPSSLYLSYRA